MTRSSTPSRTWLLETCCCSKRRSSTDFRNSGAIMVGARSSVAPHTRLGFSNNGSRIDCYAWGESVDTTSTNSEGTDNTLYTSGFNGTSSAFLVARPSHDS